MIEMEIENVLNVLMYQTCKHRHSRNYQLFFDFNLISIIYLNRSHDPARSPVNL